MGTRAPTSTGSFLTPDLFRELCDNLGVSLIATDEKLNVAFWNQQAARAFGATAERMDGTPVGQIFPADRRDEALAACERSLAGGTIESVEFRYPDETGANRELIATIAPISVGTSSSGGVSLCIRDISRRIELEKSASQAQKMSSLGEMAGAVAHHFNNILGGIFTCIDFANEQRDPSVDRRILCQINTALLRATRLVGGLLQFAEGEKRVEDLSDVTELLSLLLADVERQVANSPISLTVDLGQMPVIPVERAPVQTILRQIVQNAVEAMPDGGELTIRSRWSPPAAEITIEDSGAGMTEQELRRIFEPFFTTKGVLGQGSGKAAGLGLAIAHGIAQQIHADIRVTSTPGKGTTFRVSLRPAEDVRDAD